MPLVPRSERAQPAKSADAIAPFWFRGDRPPRCRAYTHREDFCAQRTRCAPAQRPDLNRAAKVIEQRFERSFLYSSGAPVSQAQPWRRPASVCDCFAGQATRSRGAAAARRSLPAQMSQLQPFRWSVPGNFRPTSRFRSCGARPMRAWHIAARALRQRVGRHRPCRSLRRHALSQLWRQLSCKKVKEVILIGPDLHQDHVVEAGVDKFADGLQMLIG